MSNMHGRGSRYPFPMPLRVPAWESQKFGEGIGDEAVPRAAPV
jgi:hypothetical protein